MIKFFGIGLLCLITSACGGGSNDVDKSKVNAAVQSSNSSSSTSSPLLSSTEVLPSSLSISSNLSGVIVIPFSTSKSPIDSNLSNPSSFASSSAVDVSLGKGTILVIDSGFEALSRRTSYSSRSSSSAILISSSSSIVTISSSFSDESSEREAINAKSSVALSSAASLQSSSVDLSSSSIMSTLSSLSSLSLTSSSLNSSVNDLGSSSSSLSSYATSAIAESSASANAATSSQPKQAIKSDIQLKREVDEAVSQVDQQSIENISLSLKKSFGNEVTDYEWAVDYEHTLDAMFRSSTSISPTSIQCKLTKCLVTVVVNDDEQSLISLEMVRDSVDKALSVTPKVFFVTDRENHQIEFYFSRSLEGNLFQ